MVLEVELKEEDDLKYGAKTFDFNMIIILINVLGFGFSFSFKLILALMIGIFHQHWQWRTHYAKENGLFFLFVSVLMAMLSKP